MADTERIVKNVRIKASLDVAKSRSDEIGPDDLVQTTDYNLPIPTLADDGKVIAVDANNKEFKYVEISEVKVDDVKLDGVSTVTNKIAYINSNILVLNVLSGPASSWTSAEKAIILSNLGINEAISASLLPIEALIPSEASATNKLADKSFVNSSIATNTAYFKGTFDCENDLGLTYGASVTDIAVALVTVITNPTNNDYSFVINEDTNGNTIYQRFKYNGSIWQYEYTLNNSSFTALQWAAINSGINEEKVADIDLNTAARHTHENKSILDTIGSDNLVSDSDRTNWNGKVSKTGDETINGIKTFNDPIKFRATISLGWAIGNQLYVSGAADFHSTSANTDLGNNTYKWRDLYLSGSLKDGTNTVAISEIMKKAPVITVTSSMVISENPLTFQLTNAMGAIIENDDNNFIVLDASALGVGASLFIRSVSNIANEYVLSNCIIRYDNSTHVIEKSTTHAAVYNSTTKQAVYSVSELENAIAVVSSLPVNAIDGDKVILESFDAATEFVQNKNYRFVVSSDFEHRSVANITFSAGSISNVKTETSESSYTGTNDSIYITPDGLTVRVAAEQKAWNNMTGSFDLLFSRAPEYEGDIFLNRDDITIYDLSTASYEVYVYHNGYWRKIGEKYKAGIGINITDTTISVDTAVIATKEDLNAKADKNGDYRADGLRAKFASNILTDRGQTIDASLTVSSGQNFADRPNNAKGTGTFYPYGSADRISIESETQKIEKVYGHSYVKNQLIDKNNIKTTQTVSGVTLTNNGDGSISFVGTATSTINVSIYGFEEEFINKNGHKILISGMNIPNSAINSLGYLFKTTSGGNTMQQWSSSTTEIKIVSANVDRLCVYIANGLTVDFTVKPKLVDLNQLDQELANRADLTSEMVIAKYPKILDWEYTANPQMIDAEDFVYSSSGINLGDEEYLQGYLNVSGNYVPSTDRIVSKNFIPVLPNYPIYFNNENIGRVAFYDDNKIFISTQDRSQNVTTPTNCHYIKYNMTATYGTTYNHDIQICLHYTDTELENTYHPYVAPATKEIHYYGGVGRSAGNVRDEVDYVAKKRIKRVGSVDLGTLDWTYIPTTQEYPAHFRTVGIASLLPVITFQNNLRCSKYPFKRTLLLSDDKVVNGSAYYTYGQINVVDSSYNDATTFKQAMTGVILNYELATPLEEDIPTAEQNNILPCNDYGIERKSDGVIAGMKVLYQVNVVDTVFNNKEDIETLKNLVGSNTTELSSKLNALGFYQLPTPPADASTKTYSLKLVNGVLTYVEEQ